MVLGPVCRDMAKSWVLGAAIVGSSMSFIDGSAVNVALPILQADFHASAADVQWVVEGYSLFLSALILIGGSLGDIFGRRLVFCIGIAIFALGSVACAFAPAINILIIARCVQGMGGALAVPGSLALISAAYQGVERGKAIGTWSGFASLTGALGPVIGGYLAQHFSWRYVFIINVPMAIIVLAISFWRVEETRDESADFTVDWRGAILATAGLGALVYGLIRLQDGRLDIAGLVSCGVGLALLAAFIVCEKRVRVPMMPLSVFSSRLFTASNIYTFFLYAALGGSLYFVPFALIDVQGYSPTAAGAAFLPFVVIQFVSSRWAGGLVGRIGARIPLTAGASLAGVAFALYALPAMGGSYWMTYFPAAVVLGLGGVLFIAPLTTTVLDAVDRSRSGIASGINNAVSRAAGLVAIAVLGIVLATVFAHSFDPMIARAHVSEKTRTAVQTERAQLIAGTVPPVIAGKDRAVVQRALGESYLGGFRAVMLASAGVCWLSAVLAWFMFPAKPVGGKKKSAAAA
jgi:EmrB/QacA subfamily drug resistance transporter